MHCSAMMHVVGLVALLFLAPAFGIPATLSTDLDKRHALSGPLNGYNFPVCPEMTLAMWNAGWRENVTDFLAKEIKAYKGNEFLWNLKKTYLKEVAPDGKCTGNAECSVRISSVTRTGHRADNLSSKSVVKARRTMIRRLAFWHISRSCQFTITIIT